ncbi:MAG: hypothetical protein WD448_04100 [Woeseia sp.]
MGFYLCKRQVELVIRVTLRLYVMLDQIVEAVVLAAAFDVSGWNGADSKAKTMT